ncbi:MAG TPA: molybdopterin converting factor [Armatimonadetes bacterium]|nr:molybdopterin converting factor [Armatimonadota bacterium]
MRILVFGPLRDYFDADAIDVPDEVAGTPNALLQYLTRVYPDVKNLLSHCRVARNGEYIQHDDELSPTDEVAIIPPVSGGADADADIDVDESPYLCQITQGQIDIARLLQYVHVPTAGGMVLFIGAVRAHSHGRTVHALEYDAYIPMAERELTKIAADVCQRWDVTKVAIVHRIGQLKVGDVSIVIAVSAPHRVAAFEASRYIIERIKTDVPIWKREIYADGARWIGVATMEGMKERS